jgi:hypothetical protein
MGVCELQIDLQCPKNRSLTHSKPQPSGLLIDVCQHSFPTFTLSMKDSKASHGATGIEKVTLARIFSSWIISGN